MKCISNLTHKQQVEFKQIVKLLDNKDYKKGMKQVTKFAEVVQTGEVLSLKAIFLFYSDQQQEGAALAKQALFKNLKSDFCWHIYGLIHKAQKNYSEAIKCFQQSLKNENDNLQLLKDLANLQLHVRDYEGHAETRRSLLFTKTSLIFNWVAFAVGNHLVSNQIYLKNFEYEQAQQALQSTQNLIVNNESNKLKSVEENEVYIIFNLKFLLYQATLMIQLSQYDEAIKFLEENKTKITDRLSLNDVYFTIAMKQNNTQDAEKYAKNLIELQPQNWRYYQQFFQVFGVDEKQPEQLVKLLKDNFNIKDNTLLKGRLLGYITVDEFEAAFSEFITPYFTRALPSLFREIIHVYKDLAKVPLMEKAYKLFLENEDPMSQLWAHMLLAQHYNYLKEYEIAANWIDLAIQHTPTLHELYLVQARIYKGKKDFVSAAQIVDYARKLDLADRYLNNKAIKYALRANQIYQAQDLIKLFLRDSNESNPHEIQTMWYELAMGQAYQRLNYHGPSFRMFKFIEKHFGEMYEDQLEFYQFNMRKYSIRTLFDMIKSMDKVNSNKYLIQCAGFMIKGLLQYVEVSQKKKSNDDENEKKKLTPAEKKKQQKMKAKVDEDEILVKQYTIEGHIYTPEHRIKLDLSGSQILATLQDEKSILNEVNQFAKLLINTSYVKGCFYSFTNLVDYYIEQNRTTLAMKLLNKLISYTDDSNQVVAHKYKLKLLLYCINFLILPVNQAIKVSKQDPQMVEALQEGLNDILKTQTVEHYNQQFFDKCNDKSLRAQIIAYESRQIFASQKLSEFQQNQILTKKAKENQQQFIFDLITQSKTTVQDIYDAVEENPYLLERLKDFIQKEYPTLFIHYFSDPNKIWQKKQIDDNRKIQIHLEESKKSSQ